MAQENPHNEPSEELPPLTWETIEYRHTEKGADWFLAVGVIAISFAVTAFIFSDILFGVFIIVAAGTLMLYALRPPETMEIGIDDNGVAVGSQFYEFSDLESFWIEETDVEQPVLLLKSKHTFTPLISLWIDDEEVDVEEVRDHLAAFLDEEELSEPLSQRIMELLGF